MYTHEQRFAYHRGLRDGSTAKPYRSPVAGASLDEITLAYAKGYFSGMADKMADDFPEMDRVRSTRRCE